MKICFKPLIDIFLNFYLIHAECRKFKKLIATKILIGTGFEEDGEDDDPSAIVDYNCKHQFTSLIVGGQKTEPGEFPHMAAIGWRLSNGSATFHCGGSLISERFVLSVAHCTTLDG